MTRDDPFMLVLALITGILALTRAVRLVVDDEYPPMVKIREWYCKHTSEQWNPLIECPWCAAPYLAVPAVAGFALLVAFPSWTALLWAWWIVNGWAAASWLASFLNVRDTPPD